MRDPGVKTIVKLGAILLVVVVLAIGAGGYRLYRSVHTPAMMVGEATRVVVRPGSSLRSIARTLDESGLIGDRRPFIWYARLRGDAGKIHAGEFEIPAGATPAQVLEQLVSGKVFLHALTIVEGWTYRDLLAVLAEHPAVTQTITGLDGEELMTRLGKSGQDPEGWFYPDTYLFERGTTDLTLLRLASENMSRELAQAWENRATSLDLQDPYEALILASIVERETALDSERPVIAGVFLRRLQKKMRLQTDPTVIYGLGADFDGNLRRADLQRDTPYNTYTRHGLPPTPISLPGRASLRAVTRPAAGDTLYFVATGEPDGSHYFSRSIEEHNAAVARYLQKLKERKP